MATLDAMLAADVSPHADDGGKRSATHRPIFGFARVIKVHNGLAEPFRRRGSGLVHLGFINGLPGFLMREADGKLQPTALDIEDDKVVAIYVMRSPDKRRHNIGRCDNYGAVPFLKAGGPGTGRTSDFCLRE